MSTGSLPESLPLFPLNTVLFPGGLLPLRVFEARYVDMIGERMRAGLEFGVCLIASGKEVGAPAQPETIGCRARIIDWNMAQLGVLQISTIGTRRFRILDQQVTPAGLVIASVQDESDGPQTMGQPEGFDACAALLERILGQIDEQVKAAGANAPSPIAQPYQLDNTEWVTNRLAEMLPLAPHERQQLLCLPAVPARFEAVLSCLREHQAI